MWWQKWVCLISTKIEPSLHIAMWQHKSRSVLNLNEMLSRYIICRALWWFKSLCLVTQSSLNIEPSPHRALWPLKSVCSATQSLLNIEPSLHIANSYVTTQISVLTLLNIESSQHRGMWWLKSLCSKFTKYWVITTYVEAPDISNHCCSSFLTFGSHKKTLLWDRKTKILF